VEASAIQHPAGLSRLPLTLPLLRLRSDEQLLALFRAGHDEAFGVLHDRYRQRLFAYVRQMLSSLSRQDAEDVLQDVFVRAYGALRADAREMNVRAWLYRVAHNRCIDHLRRPLPPAAEIYEVSRRPSVDPTEEAQRREDLARLVDDIARLPEQQRSALLMRELDGLSYADLAHALDVTVPAVKSLLVRARVGLVDAAEARDADCAEIRADLVAACDRGVKASGRCRRHVRTCSACAEYRTALRGMRRSFAALSPVGLGPVALGAQLLGLGGAGGGAAAGGAAAAGGGLATATACKVAAVVCTAAIATGGAVEVQQMAVSHKARNAPAAPAAAARAPAAPADPLVRRVPLQTPLLRHGAPAADSAPAVRKHHALARMSPTATAEPRLKPATTGALGAGAPAELGSSGGVQAPDAVATDPDPTTPAAPAAAGGAAATPATPDGAAIGDGAGDATLAGGAGEAAAPTEGGTAPSDAQPQPPQR
jgi:RNA polymerase sigma factor (sigma-70 family)